ncbi:DUF5333 domain-containing protein [Tateyamaria sp.]|nr:DUF5333 domain-containing protein [Tateyamaria sp.]
MRAMTMALMFCITTAGASANPHLRDVPEIDGTLLHIGIANSIRKNCPDISARILRATRVIFGVKKQARDLGYTEEEIDAYRNSDVEKTRLKALRAKYLADAGVEADQPQTFCDLGRAEIKKGGRIGTLLRMD